MDLVQRLHSLRNHPNQKATLYEGASKNTTLAAFPTASLAVFRTATQGTVLDRGRVPGFPTFSPFIRLDIRHEHVDYVIKVRSALKYGSNTTRIECNSNRSIMSSIKKQHPMVDFSSSN